MALPLVGLGLKCVANSVLRSFILLLNNLLNCQLITLIAREFKKKYLYRTKCSINLSTQAYMYRYCSVTA